MFFPVLTRLFLWVGLRALFCVFLGVAIARAESPANPPTDGSSSSASESQGLPDSPGHVGQQSIASDVVVPLELVEGPLPNAVIKRASKLVPPPPDPFRVIQDDSNATNLNLDDKLTVDPTAIWHTGKALQRAMPTFNMVEGRTAQQPPPDDASSYGSYHWSGLLVQSLAFNVIENLFRAATDENIGLAIAHKPFFHDYVKSMQQFNMGRWNDGDDFMVNYIGHPLQGSVSGFIEVQNDPRGRQTEFGDGKEYWNSRFKAFLWATVYSTHSEIGPLGEAGVGNEGGFTYPLPTNCRGCRPGKLRYTNNTGWVDFIITPVVGTLWMIGEDILDRFVSDRVQDGNLNRHFPMVVRGALNPSRTMANAMRMKFPWYRDFQHDPEVEAYMRGTHFLASDEDVARARSYPRIQIAPYVRSVAMGTPGITTDVGNLSNIVLRGPGAGVDASYAFNRWSGITVAADRTNGPTPVKTDRNGAPQSTGTTWSAGVGLYIAHEGPLYSLRLAIREGTVSEKATLPVVPSMYPTQYVKPKEFTVTRPATTIMLSGDYHLTPKLAIRTSIGDSIVRYRSPIEDPAGIGTPPNLSWLSHDNYYNRSTWICEAGPVLRFGRGRAAD